MSKTIQRVFRMAEPLNTKVDEAAEARGMNFSEFMRYVITSFFDYDVDSKPHNLYYAEPRGQGVLLEPRAEYDVKEAG